VAAVRDESKIPCKVVVGETTHEFWVAADLLDAPASQNNDARQDVVTRRFAMSFAQAYHTEAARRRGDLGAEAPAATD
jgi:hypothetical protein